MSNMTIGAVRSGRLHLPGGTSSAVAEGAGELKSTLKDLKDNYRTIESKINQETMK